CPPTGFLSDDPPRPRRRQLADRRASRVALRCMSLAPFGAGIMYHSDARYGPAVPEYRTRWYDNLVPVVSDVNPFIYSHPIGPDDIIDRDEETTQLLTAAVGGHYVRL